MLLLVLLLPFPATAAAAEAQISPQNQNAPCGKKNKSFAKWDESCGATKCGRVGTVNARASGYSRPSRLIPGLFLAEDEARK